MLIKLYTDGACKNNPGQGGWSCILSTVLSNGKVYEKEHSGGFRLTTNNRMEITAAIEGLLCVNGTDHEIEIYSDSKYVCDAFNSNWIENWKKNGWKTQNKKQVLNKDLWVKLSELVEQFKSVKFIWVKGHSDNEYNIRCDNMAVYETRKGGNMQNIDEVYERAYHEGVV